MLVEFRFKNHRSYRDEEVLSMEATEIFHLQNCLIKKDDLKILPGVAILGKNGGGKSNVIGAFWLAVQFICNAQKIQNEKVRIPVEPFALNDYSGEEPSEFTFYYIFEKIKYWYSFSATKEKIIRESLYFADKEEKTFVFEREYQQFRFKEKKPVRNLISEMVAENQLFLAVACAVNDAECRAAMRWFRDYVFFSKDYSGFYYRWQEYFGDSNIMSIIESYAKISDLDIEKVKFEIDDRGRLQPSRTSDFIYIQEDAEIESPHIIMELAESANYFERNPKPCKINAKTLHQGVLKDGRASLFELQMKEESDGAKRLMFLSVLIESTLNKGGVFFIDDIEWKLHPMLVNFLIAKFQSRHSNPQGAQIIFTTHNTEILDLNFLRKDQIYFANKNKENGVSELYSVTEYKTADSDNVRNEYLRGKYGAAPNLEIEHLT